MVGYKFVIEDNFNYNFMVILNSLHFDFGAFTITDNLNFVRDYWGFKLGILNFANDKFNQINFNLKEFVHLDYNFDLENNMAEIDIIMLMASYLNVGVEAVFVGYRMHTIYFE